MMLEPVFSSRDFQRVLTLPRLDWKVERCTWALPGGPETAVLRARGTTPAGWDWTELLRCPVELTDEHGLAVWWGYAAAVELDGVRLSLDGMYNRVRVDYRYVANSDPLKAVAEDLFSQELYGQKELYFDLGVVDHAARAQSLAEGWLERTCRPQQNFAGISRGLRLVLRGWWHTLGWRFDAQDGEGLRSYESEPAEEANVGSSASQARGAQGFYGPVTGLEWTASRIKVNVRKVGSPADFLHIGIQTDSDGNPSGSELEGIDVPAGSLTTSLAWYEYELPRLTAALKPGQRYHIVFSRTGGNNSTNYYRVGVATPPAVSGALYYKTWNGTSWVQRTPNSIAVHAVWGETSSGRMIQALCGPERGGQFLRGCDVPLETGRWTAAYRPETHTYRRLFTDLLALGSTEGRLSAEITAGRGLRVFAMGTEGEEVQVRADGTLAGADGHPLPAHKVPLGRRAWSASLPGRGMVVERARWEAERLVLG